MRRTNNFRLGSHRERQIELVPYGSAEILEGVDLDRIGGDDRRALQRLVSVVRLRGEATFRLSANTQYRVGRWSKDGLTITVRPPFTEALFTALYSYATRGRTALPEYSDSAASHYTKSNEPAFLTLMSRLMVDEATEILETRIAQHYNPRREPLHVIRGTPDWKRNFGRHPATGVDCTYRQLETDTLINNLIAAGVRAASTVLRSDQYAKKAGDVDFAWQSLTSYKPPSLPAFESTIARLSRLDEHYRSGLVLAQALTFRERPRDPFTAGPGRLQAIEFSLDRLFEQFVGKFLRAVAPHFGLSVDIQRPDNRALVDGLNQPYRSVRPDYVLRRRAKDVVVLDAKFKPRYLEAAAGSRIPTHLRVSNGDIYQLLFYAARSVSSGRAKAPPLAVLIAPLLPPERPLPELTRRTIRHSGEDAVYELRVLAFPLSPVLASLAAGNNEIAVLKHVPELQSLLEALAVIE